MCRYAAPIVSTFMIGNEEAETIAIQADGAVSGWCWDPRSFTWRKSVSSNLASAPEATVVAAVYSEAADMLIWSEDTCSRPDGDGEMHSSHCVHIRRHLLRTARRLPGVVDSAVTVPVDDSMSHIIVMDDRLCLLGSTHRTWTWTFARQQLQEAPIPWAHYSVQGLGGAVFILDASDKLWQIRSGMTEEGMAPLVSDAARHRAPSSVSSSRAENVLGLLTRLHIVVVATKTHSNVFLDSLGTFLASIDHATVDFDAASARVFRPLSAGSVAPPAGLWCRSGIWQLRTGKIADLLHRLATQAHSGSGADTVEQLLVARHISARWSLDRWETKVLLDLCVARSIQPQQLLRFATQLSNRLSSPVLIAEVLCSPMYRNVVTQMLTDFSRKCAHTVTVSDELTRRKSFDIFSSLATALAPTVSRFLETSAKAEALTSQLGDSANPRASERFEDRRLEDRNDAWLQRCSEAELWRAMNHRPKELQEVLESRLGIGSKRLNVAPSPMHAPSADSIGDARMYIELLLCL
jgi:hypothetical protein